MTVTKVSCTSFLTGTRVRTLEVLSVCVHIAHASVLYRVSQNYTKQHFNALMCLGELSLACCFTGQAADKSGASETVSRFLPFSDGK